MATVPTADTPAVLRMSAARSMATGTGSAVHVGHQAPQGPLGRPLSSSSPSSTATLASPTERVHPEGLGCDRQPELEHPVPGGAGGALPDRRHGMDLVRRSDGALVLRRLIVGPSGPSGPTGPRGPARACRPSGHLDGCHHRPPRRQPGFGLQLGLDAVRSNTTVLTTPEVYATEEAPPKTIQGPLVWGDIDNQWVPGSDQGTVPHRGRARRVLDEDRDG